MKDSRIAKDTKNKDGGIGRKLRISDIIGILKSVWNIIISTACQNKSEYRTKKNPNFRSLPEAVKPITSISLPHFGHFPVCGSGVPT